MRRVLLLGVVLSCRLGGGKDSGHLDEDYDAHDEDSGDTDDTGVVDTGDDIVESWPCTAEMTVDQDVDGTIELRRLLTFDETGVMTRSDDDRGDDGALDAVTTWTRVDGQLMSVERDDAPLGDIDSTRTYVWELGLNVRIDADLDGDGAVDQRTTHSFDSDDRIVRIETDNDLDALPDMIREQIWVDGHLDWMGVDRDVDGEWDTTTQWTWVYGLVSTIEADQDGDGEIDTRTTYTWTETGSQFEVDDVPFGSLDRFVVNTNDALDRQVLIEDDVDADGTVDVRTETVWDCTGDGS
jgi:hypothetical protein